MQIFMAATKWIMAFETLANVRVYHIVFSCTWKIKKETKDKDGWKKKSIIYSEKENGVALHFSREIWLMGN